MNEPSGGSAHPQTLSRPRWRLRLSRWIYPWWTEGEVDSIHWRAHQARIGLGLRICHEYDEPCQATADTPPEVSP
jgi:hypothetical protein